MKHTVKWGIIGLGNIAFEFAKSFYNADNADLIAVASTSNDNLDKFKQKYNINSENLYNSYEELLENKNIDIIYIALPNSFHFEWLLKAIEKNKNILVEKPALVSNKQAETVFKHKNFKNIFFSEGYMYRYHPQISKTIKIIKAGEIGRPISMNSNFGVNLIYKKNFFGFKKKKIDRNKRIFNKNLGGGVILDQGCYTTSMSLLIASLIENIDITNFKLTDINTEYIDSNIDVCSTAKINFDNKFLSHITASFKDDTGKNTVIFGENGKIILENTWNPKETKIELSGKINKVFKFENSVNIYSLEIKHISEDIINGKTEASYPGINKNNILLNTKLINHWVNE
jgi:predicted dehydrogenase